MELEFGKHFKDATNLLLMMDHDSGYVEGTESWSSSNESEHLHRGATTRKSFCDRDNFLLNEDALLEKPELFFDLAANLPLEIDRDEQPRVFASPDVVSSSVPSQNSTAEYSGLENESISSQKSVEILFVAPIAVATQDMANVDNEGQVDNDILMISATESDMSLEQTFDPLILECCSNKKVISPFNGFGKYEASLNDSAIATLTSECLKGDKREKGPDSEEKNELQTADKEQSVQESLDNNSIPKTPAKPESDEQSESINIQQNPTKSTESGTPSKVNTPLGSVTNTFDFDPPQFIPKDKKRLTLIFSKAEKENRYSVKRKFLSLTPEKSTDKSLVDPNISPDIFGEEELDAVDDKPGYFEMAAINVTEETYVQKLDKKLLKRVQSRMSGVPPPPSVTVIRMTAQHILSKLDENKSCFFWNKQDEVVGEGALNISGDSDKFRNSLLLSVGLEEAKKLEFSEAYNTRCLGLHYNCGKVSEEIVDLCDKYQKRFVGGETQSTCTVFETQNAQSSPSKRKTTTKSKWGGTKSPGRRLSHLARRRITFSSSNLQVGSGSALAGSRARQILVDAKKLDLMARRRSPRKSPRKTPLKSPKIKTRTPSSSAKKKLAIRFRKLTGEIEKSVPSTSGLSSVPRVLFRSPAAKSESSKRALFQSPSRDTTSSLNLNGRSSSSDRSQLRRALFTSPNKNKSPFKRAGGPNLGYEKKRKRSDSDELAPPSKLPRSMSLDVRPSTSNVGNRRVIPRAQSELDISANKGQQNELSEQHKKKLLWAVSIALQSQQVTSVHPQWKVFASVLARVTRRFYTSQLAAGVATADGAGTSERMQRIARSHVIAVVKGKSADEIIAEYVKDRAGRRARKPQGYVAPERHHVIPAGDVTVAARKLAPSGGKENVFQDRANTIESREKRKLEGSAGGHAKSTLTDNKIERIRKVINFGDDR